MKLLIGKNKKNEILERTALIEERYSRLVEKTPDLFLDFYKKCGEHDYTYSDMTIAIIGDTFGKKFIDDVGYDKRSGLAYAYAMFEYAYEKDIIYDIEGFEETCQFAHGMYEFNDEYEKLLDDVFRATGEYIQRTQIVFPIDSFKKVYILE